MLMHDSHSEDVVTDLCEFATMRPHSLVRGSSIRSPFTHLADFCRIDSFVG